MMDCMLRIYDSRPEVERIVEHPTPWGDMRIEFTHDNVVTAAHWVNERESPYRPLPQCEGIALINPSQFVVDVFSALLRVKPDETVTYSELAAAAGHPGAARAVGNVMARNDIALYLPCHRVTPADASVGRYRWGADRKRALLNLELQLGLQF